MSAHHVLIIGASGYIASRLIPRLLQAGHRVRCLVRNPKKLAFLPWSSQVECVAADLTQPDSLPSALENIDTAYYLVHSMLAGRGYDQLDLQAARNLSRASHQAGVKHIIYLGGLVSPDRRLARHLRSRIETGLALREAGVPVTEFRAGVIAGPGSVSFEMIRYIAEQFPLMLGPRWLEHRSQPIAISDVIEYLLLALETPACWDAIIELGCETPRTYIQVMREYARLRGLPRLSLLLPLIPPWLMALFVSWMAPVPFSYALPLVEGLQNDSLVSNDAARRLFPTLKPLDYAEAVRRALGELHPRNLHRQALQPAPGGWLRGEGFLVKTRWRPLNTPPPLLPLVEAWETETQDSAAVSLLKARGHFSGLLWLESRPRPEGGFLQTLFFAPRGLSGFLYGSFLMGGWR